MNKTALWILAHVLYEVLSANWSPEFVSLNANYKPNLCGLETQVIFLNAVERQDHLQSEISLGDPFLPKLSLFCHENLCGPIMHTLYGPHLSLFMLYVDTLQFQQEAFHERGRKNEIPFQKGATRLRAQPVSPKSQSL